MARPASAPCAPSFPKSSTNSSTAATSNAAAPASLSWFRMIAFRHWFDPSLTARLWRGCALDAPVPGNTLTPVNANQDQVMVLREVTGSTCLSGAGRNEVNGKAERAILLPAFPALRGVSICWTPALKLDWFSGGARRALRLSRSMNPPAPPPPGIHAFAQPMLPHQFSSESVNCSPKDPRHD